LPSIKIIEQSRLEFSDKKSTKKVPDEEDEKSFDVIVKPPNPDSNVGGDTIGQVLTDV